MKKTFLLLTVLFVCCSIFASTQIRVGLDGLFFQDFFISKSAVQVNMDTAIDLNDSYQLRLPITASIKQDAFLLDTGVFAVCYPYKNLFFGMSMLQLAINVKGSSLEKTTFALNEVMAGWTFRFKNGLYVEPAILIRDPSNTYQDEYSALRGVFPCYSTVRLRCIVGYSFSIGGKHEAI